MARPRKKPNVEYRAEDSVGFRMQLTLRSFRRMLRACIAGDGIGLGEWYYLRVLWERDGLSQRELTERVGMMQPTTASTLRLMEANGLVRLERDRTDRRKLRVFLTDKAWALKQSLLPDIVHINERVALKGFSPSERRLLNGLLERMRSNIDLHLEKTVGTAAPRPRAGGAPDDWGLD
ncbi:MAG: MarR family winged helix-turn-helix transcriptional regulator [Rhodospirillaceae bacterium]